MRRPRRHHIVAALCLAAMTAGCGQATDDSADGATSSTPEPTANATDDVTPSETKPAGTEFNFCSIIDLAKAAEVAGDFSPNAEPGTTVALNHRTVSTAWSPSDNTVVEVSELCDYGPDGVRTALMLQAYPEGHDDEERPGEPRPELGEGAYFLRSDDFFTLSVPAGRSYLTLTGRFTSSADTAAGEQALRTLLEPAAAAVPSDAVLEGKVGGERCAPLEGPVTEALSAEVDYSRHIEIGPESTCTFTALGTGAEAVVSLEPGQAGDYQQGRQTPITGLENAWRTDSGSTTIVRGDDAVTIHLLGAGGSAERDGNGDYAKDEELARAVTPILLG